MSTDGYNRDSGARMIVYITRHGQPSRSINQIDVPGDPPLSELGKEQARLLGQRLAWIKFNAASEDGLSDDLCEPTRTIGTGGSCII